VQFRITPGDNKITCIHHSFTLHQTLIDPDDLNDWSLHLTLDLEKYNETRTTIFHLESVAPS
jgi:hypothetical protein